jgi:hypothetical protein
MTLKDELMLCDPRESAGMYRFLRATHIHEMAKIGLRRNMKRKNRERAMLKRAESLKKLELDAAEVAASYE